MRRIAAGLAALAALGCNPSDALDVRDIDVVEPGTLTGKGALPSIVNSTFANFQIAFSGGADQANGGSEGQVNVSALLSDEFLHAETFPDRLNVDMRNIAPGNGSMKGVFLDLSRSRAFADFASGRFNQFDAGGQGHADVLNLGGFSYVFFAENYCNGVPLSTMNDNGVLVFGQPQTGAHLLTTAVAKFDSALTFARANHDTEQDYLAQIGKGRALLGLNQAVAARNAVAGVPTSFVFNIEGSDNSIRQNNGVWNYTLNTNAFSVSDHEGGNGLAFFSASDPRVPAFDLEDVGFDGQTPFIAQEKYPRLDSDVALATGIEARLIEAEAALRVANTTDFLSILNTLRTSNGLGAVTLPATPAARENLLFSERAFWMYLTGHRLGDLRRLVRQYNRTQAQVFPTGEYHKGGNYGTDVNLPVSADEKNNPNFSACIDKNA